MIPVFDSSTFSSLSLTSTTTTVTTTTVTTTTVSRQESRKGSNIATVASNQFANRQLEHKYSSTNTKAFTAQKGGIQLSQDNPFYDTDLAVYPNDYQGEIPSYGIKKSEFLKLTEVYNNICQGKTKIKISGSKTFTGLVKDCIKKLMTREIGRELIFTMLQSEKLKELDIERPSYGEGSASGLINGKPTIYFDSSDYDRYDSVCFFHFDPEYSNLYGTNGRLNTSPFIILAHEMIHILYWGRREHLSLISESLASDFSDAEELATICGYAEFQTGKTQMYPFSENAIRAAFNLPFRTTNWTLLKKSDYTIKGKVVDNFLNDKIVRLIKGNIESEIQEFLAINKNLASVKDCTGKNILISLMEVAIRYHRFNIFKMLEDAYSRFPNSASEDLEYWNLFYQCIKNKAYEIFTHLSTKEHCLDEMLLTDEQENNLLHHLLDYFPEDPDYEKMAMECLNILLKSGISIHDTNLDGESAIYYAAIVGKAEIVKIFLSMGASLDFRDYYGETLLYRVVKARNFRGTLALLANNASLNVSDNKGISIIQMAMGCSTYEIINLLLKENPNLNELTSEGETLLHLVASNPLLDVNQKYQLFNYLIGKGIPLTKTDSLYRTYLLRLDPEDLLQLILLTPA